MAIAGFVSNALNTTLPINMNQVASYRLSNDGLHVIFQTAFGAVKWTFDTAPHATAAMVSLNTFVGSTAITN